MVDELNKSNLEPIEENDLNLKDKFIGVEKSSSEMPTEISEVPTSPEAAVERKEGLAEKDGAYSKILSKITHAAPVAQDDISNDADAVSREQDAENKINNLVNLAQMKGVAHAVKVARHLEDNYVLDEFHDRLLSDELHDALLQKGIIKGV